MGNNVQMSIPIPTDDDGYILLRCSYCGTFFKVTPYDVEDEGILELYCPSCGLSSKNYMTDDVIKLALTMLKNTARDIIYDNLKEMSLQFSKGSNIGGRPKHEPELSIRSGIEALEGTSFPCCNRIAKIKPLLKMTGCYCPFCGVKNYEVE